MHCTMQLQCMLPRCHAMHLNARTGKSNKQGRLMVPGKVWLQLNVIKCCHDGCAPCYTTQPSSFVAPKHTPASQSMYGYHTKCAVCCNCWWLQMQFCKQLLVPYISKQPHYNCRTSATESNGYPAYAHVQHSGQMPMQVQISQGLLPQMQMRQGILTQVQPKCKHACKSSSMAIKIAEK